MTLPNEVRTERRVRTSGVEIAKMALMTVGALSVIGLLSWAVKIVVGLLNKSSDTPIVIGGGSIYGKTDDKDTRGWVFTSSGSYYTASLSPSSGNTEGIDYLVFTKFDEQIPPAPGQAAQFTDPYILRGTQGWKLEFSNQDGAKNEKKHAVLACSNGPCDTTSCSSSLGPLVYLQGAQQNNRARFDARIPQALSIVQEVHFHDTDTTCDGGSNDTHEGACDTLNKVWVATCKSVTGAPDHLTCSKNPTQCSVTVGHR